MVFSFSGMIWLATARADPEGVDWVASHPPLEQLTHTNQKQYLACTYSSALVERQLARLSFNEPTLNFIMAVRHNPAVFPVVSTDIVW